MSAIPSKKKIKDDGQYNGVTNIDNILDTVMYSDGTCKKIYKLIIKKKYNQRPTSQMSWPGEFENENIELPWKDIYI